MKKVVQGNVLSEKLEEAIDLLCGTVKQTLGPMGNNVIIDHSNFRPFITNDGVTIAKNIESDDKVVGTIVEIAKEASIKTDENVGDGTTSTLVLLESLIKLSQKYIKKGINPLVLKKSLQLKLEEILKKLEELKMEVTLSNLKNIARVSANDRDIGELVGDIVENIDDKEAITIKEKSGTVLEAKYIRGYICSITHPSEYYFQDKKTISCDEAYILIVNDYISDIENLSDILNDAMANEKPLVIVARDFDEYFINEIISLNFEGKIKCFMLKISEYGLHERIIQKDLEMITGASIAERSSNITGANIGMISHLYLDKESLRISYRDEIELSDYIGEIEENIKNIEDEFDREFYQKRKAMFTKGMVEINIGAPTKAECHERRMRLDDAICSTYVAKKGILPGGGVALLEISETINDNSEASLIWKETLQKPFEQIMSNAVLNGDEIKEKIKKRDYKIIYNVCTEEYEWVSDTNIVDAYLVVRNSLINACSIAIMLLSTTSLVINEYQNNINKVNDYIEI